ncbi:MAG TPA: class I SAM-dependent methyltransferase [Solirubrobacterales bacterium]|jgi:SAM-dependent methyltransferase
MRESSDERRGGPMSGGATDGGPSGGYTFGDSEPAARRLALVAATFAKTTRQFLLMRAGIAPGFAVDLGCGPGYTTELIRATVGPARLLGVDVSPAYVAAAAKRLADDRTRMLCADVLDLPPEVADADLIYARFLLTHLREPPAAIEAWRERLSERGVLLLEEVESIATEERGLAGYLDLQREMLAANGNTLEIGPRLDAELGGNPAVRSSQVVEFSPPSVIAARMFAMNLVTWRERPEVAAAHDAEELDEVAAGLERIASGEGGSSPITWRMRQIVLTRE